jgi:hypothetical protein
MFDTKTLYLIVADSGKLVGVGAIKKPHQI